MNAYQVIGHFKTLRPEYISPATVSDGAIFEHERDAQSYAREKMHSGYCIKRIDNVNPRNVRQGNAI